MALHSLASPPVAGGLQAPVRVGQRTGFFVRFGDSVRKRNPTRSRARLGFEIAQTRKAMSHGESRGSLPYTLLNDLAVAETSTLASKC